KDKVDLGGVYGGTFKFLGSGAFTGHAGELHYGVSGSDLLVSGDVNGDGVADFELKLIGIATIEAGDFVL
ncbi:MAG: hypothetical protein JWR77_1433, partial [Rhizorhabdus sp.]|nr:hypothetical protein [Rhizorhabdus sp.]